MIEKRLKRPRDPVELGKLIGDILTGQVEDQEPIPEGKDAGAVEFARKGGLKGGEARAAKLAPERRAEIAKKLLRRGGVIAVQRRHLNKTVSATGHKNIGLKWRINKLVLEPILFPAFP
jgi:hypothetical protein